MSSATPFQRPIGDPRRADPAVDHAEGVSKVHNGILNEVAVLKKLVRSVYGAKELEEAARLKSHDQPCSDDEDFIPCDDDGYPKTLSELVRGRARIDILLKNLQTETRVDLVSGMATWFEERLPRARLDEQQLAKREAEAELSPSEDGDWDEDEGHCFHKMQAFYGKIEEAMRVKGLIEGDRARLTDARKRAKGMGVQFDPLQLTRIQEQCTVLRDELLERDESDEAELEEMESRNNHIEELQKKIASKKADLETLTQRVSAAKVEGRLINNALVQVTQSGICKTWSDLRIDGKSEDVVREQLNKLRDERPEFLRERRPDVKEVEMEVEIAEASWDASQKKLKELKDGQVGVVKQMIAAGIDPECALQSVEVYKEKEEKLKAEIDKTCLEVDKLEQQNEELKACTSNMEESSQLMEDQQAPYWENVSQAFQNLLDEDEEAVAEAVQGLMRQDTSASVAVHNIDNDELQQMFVKASRDKAQLQLKQEGTATQEGGAEAAGTREQTGHTVLSLAVPVTRRASVADRQGMMAASIEMGCKDIWARVAAVRKSTKYKAPASRRVETQSTHRPEAAFEAELEQRLATWDKAHADDLRSIWEIEDEVGAFDAELESVKATFFRKLEEETQVRLEEVQEENQTFTGAALIKKNARTEAVTAQLGERVHNLEAAETKPGAKGGLAKALLGGAPRSKLDREGSEASEGSDESGLSDEVDELLDRETGNTRKFDQPSATFFLKDSSDSLSAVKKLMEKATEKVVDHKKLKVDLDADDAEDRNPSKGKALETFVNATTLTDKFSQLRAQSKAKGPALMTFGTRSSTSAGSSQEPRLRFNNAESLSTQQPVAPELPAVGKARPPNGRTGLQAPQGRPMNKNPSSEALSLRAQLGL